MDKKEIIGLAFIFIVVIGSLILMSKPQEEAVTPVVEQPAPPEPEPEPYQSKTHNIKLGEDYAEPDFLSIRIGDTVVWENVGGGNNRRRFWIDEEIYSDLLDPGQAFSYTFEELGDHTFRDVFNGKVVGAIVVKPQPVIQITGSFLEGFTQKQKTMISVQMGIFLLAVVILAYTLIKK